MNGKILDDHCYFCDKEAKNGLKLADCGHAVHENCLILAIKTKRAEEGVLCCPACNNTIADSELKKFVSEQEWNVVEQTYIQNLIKEQGLFQCDCGNVMEIVAGAVELGLKDDQGKLLSTEAAEHMA